MTRHRPPSRNGSETRLDDVAKRIIELLQEDGRQSYAAIAKAVGLSEAAVRQRVQRLLDAEVMQIVAVTDPLQVGFSRQAMIGIRAEGDLLELLTRRIRVLPGVTTTETFVYLKLNKQHYNWGTR
ncbi:MAG TPA: AsnC family transcriptional regulator [Phycicoccus sp.]|nr:AsnC family transcriptional regulator [Phycicoccus sp.]